MGGDEPRKDRPPGWKVSWRGWRVFNNVWDHMRFADSEAFVPPQPERGTTTWEQGHPPDA
jgi:hypothetical protein